MVHPGVENPTLRNLALQFLLQPAKNPVLVSSGKLHSSDIAKFVTLDPFYNQFLRLVSERTGHSQEDIENPDLFIPQGDYLTIQGCFEESCGEVIKNPWDYQYFGQLIPRIGGGTSHLLSLTGPGLAINYAPRANRDLNNDQEVVVETLKSSNANLEGIIQHYVLPSPVRAYLTRILAPFGYWQAITDVWDIPERGTTHLIDVQPELEEVLTQDFKYLNLTLTTREDGNFLICQQSFDKTPEIPFGVAKPLTLTGNTLLDLGYVPDTNLIAKPLSEYHPLVLEDDLLVDNQLLFPKDTRFGMPCYRYKVTVPNISLVKRVKYFVLGLPRFFFGKDKLWTSPRERLSLQLYTNQVVNDRRLLAEKAAAEAETEIVLARAQAAEAKLEATTAKLALQQQIGRVTEVFGRQRTLAHDNKNRALGLMEESLTLLRDYLLENGINSVEPLQVGNNDLTTFLDNLKSSPLPHLPRLAEYASTCLDALEQIIKGERLIMGGNIPLDITVQSYFEFMGKIIRDVEKICPPVRYIYDCPSGLEIRADPLLLRAALVNLLVNAGEASSPNGTVNITPKSTVAGYRNILTLFISQSGKLDYDIAQRLNRGESFTTKEQGNGIGASAAYNIITGPYQGTIKYISKEDGALIKVSF